MVRVWYRVLNRFGAGLRARRRDPRGRLARFSFVGSRFRLSQGSALESHRAGRLFATLLLLMVRPTHLVVPTILLASIMPIFRAVDQFIESLTCPQLMTPSRRAAEYCVFVARVRVMGLFSKPVCGYEGLSLLSQVLLCLPSILRRALPSAVPQLTSHPISSNNVGLRFIFSQILRVKWHVSSALSRSTLCQK